MSDHGLISSYEGHKERRTGKFMGIVLGMLKALDVWMLARAPVHQPKASTTMDLGILISLFLYNVWP